MSVVTNVILTYGICAGENDDMELLKEINNLNEQGKLVHVEDVSLPDCWFCNGKALEANIAVGAFNYLNLKGWVKRMREQINFAYYQCDFVQLIIQEEDDVGFGIIEVWRNWGEPFSADGFKLSNNEKEI